MIEVKDPRWYELSRREALRIAERRWLERKHAEAGFSVVRLAKRTGEAYSTLYNALRRVGLYPDPKGKRSDLNPRERERREQARLQCLRDVQTTAVEDVVADLESERAGGREVRDLDGLDISDLW